MATSTVVRFPATLQHGNQLGCFAAAATWCARISSSRGVT
jgi:hypothetical protein